MQLQAYFQAMGITRNHSKSPVLLPASSKLVAKRKFKFTEKRIIELPRPESGRVYFYDSVVRGLSLAISPEKRNYVLYRKIAGRPERITIGSASDLSVDQARSKAEELNSDIARGGNPAANKRKIRDEATLQELFQTYLEHHAKPFKRTWANDVSTFNLHLSAWQFRKISAIRKMDVVNLHAKVGRKSGIYAANRLVELLSSIFGKAREWGWGGENPAAGIKAFREQKRARFMDGAELKYFFQSLAEELNETIRDYLLVSLLTGARRSNVQAMRWQEIDWRRGTWEIPAEKSKSGQSINLPLSPSAIRILETRHEDSKKEWVFPGKSKSGHLEEPKSAWKRILTRAADFERAEYLKQNPDGRNFQGHNFSDLRVHDLRRTLGSWQAATGASLPIIGKSLGHSSIQATQIYARLDLDPVRASVNKATAAMLEAGNATAMLGDGQ